jgi:hypothetical protein
MKLLFYSSDDGEVSMVEKEFAHAGIACEVRHGEGLKMLHQPPCSELWIRHDRDCHKALMLCVQLGLGFARRSPRKSFIDSWSEISTGSAPTPDELDRPIENGDSHSNEEVHPFERHRRSKVA